MTTHIIEQGETITHLALRSGLSQETIWNDEANAALREARSDMNALVPGDEVSIPDKRLKVVSAATGRRHVFRRKGIPALYRLQVLVAGKPVADRAYQFHAGHSVANGKTDSDGVVQEFVDPAVQRAVLLVSVADDDVLRIDVAFGALQASEDDLGVLQRLRNLGYVSGKVGSDDETLRTALLRFQRAEELDASGVPDEKTLARLRERHDTRALKSAR